MGVGCQASGKPRLPVLQSNIITNISVKGPQTHIHTFLAGLLSLKKYIQRNRLVATLTLGPIQYIDSETQKRQVLNKA